MEAIGRLVNIDTVVGLAVVVALACGLIWALGALTRHLRARRVGANPYDWQVREPGTMSATGDRSGQGGWLLFWSDLKATATNPYSQKSTLEKAYGACVLLFAAAIFPMPYEYYFSMRLGVCIALYFFVAAAYRQRPKKGLWFAALVGLALLYNPIMPLHLGVQLVWTAINVATIYALYRAKLALDLPFSAEASEAP